MVLGAVAGVGCGDDDAVAPADYGVPQDATTVVDAPMADAGSLDMAAQPDQGPAMVCPGLCRPDVPESCADFLTCVLEGPMPRCAPDAGTSEAGSPCESADQCAPGYACFEKRTGGVCGRVCCTEDPTACGAGEVCRGTGTLVDGTATAYGECQAPRTCDVLATSETCEVGEACYILGEGENGCLAEGVGESGTACVAPNDCAAGYACVGAFESTCARVCRLGRSDCMDVGGSCVAYAQSPDGTGLCTPDASSAR